jgi:hypothetical protein
MFNILYFKWVKVHFIVLLLSGCSVVQWLPSSACERVTYDRVGNKVTVLAECTL